MSAKQHRCLPNMKYMSSSDLKTMARILEEKKNYIPEVNQTTETYSFFFCFVILFYQLKMVNQIRRSIES